MPYQKVKRQLIEQLEYEHELLKEEVKMLRRRIEP